jgi:hypothetical protein
LTEKIENDDGRTLLETTKALVETLGASAIKYQGHAFTAFLRELTRDKDWETKVRAYKSQFESKVAAPNSTALHRIRSNFAIIWAAGALAIDYGVLPWKKSRLRKAVAKCFHRAVSVLQTPRRGGGPWIGPEHSRGRDYDPEAKAGSVQIVQDHTPHQSVGRGVGVTWASRWLHHQRRHLR